MWFGPRLLRIVSGFHFEECSEEGEVEEEEECVGCGCEIDSLRGDAAMARSAASLSSKMTRTQRLTLFGLTRLKSN